MENAKCTPMITQNNTTLAIAMAVALITCGYCSYSFGAETGDEHSKKIYSESSPKPEENIRVNVQISEIGLMRTLLILTDSAKDMEKLVAQRLTEVDFRVFPSANIVTRTPTAAEMRQVGTENKADLVLLADVKTRLKSQFGDFQLHEGEATVQISSPVSGETLISRTIRVTGERNVDPLEAERSARERALDAATKEAITKGLEKLQKMIVHVATITGVRDNNQLLIIKEHLAKMQGVYAVRQIAFDPVKQVAQLEIIGAPKSEEFWRAWLERMPRARVTVSLPSGHRERNPESYPTWFRPAKN